MGKRSRDDTAKDPARKKSKREKVSAGTKILVDECSTPSATTVATDQTRNNDSEGDQKHTNGESGSVEKAMDEKGNGVKQTNGTITSKTDPEDSKLLKKAAKKARKKANGAEVDQEAINAEMLRLQKRAAKKAKRQAEANQNGEVDTSGSAGVAKQAEKARNRNVAKTPNGIQVAESTNRSPEALADVPAYVENTQLAALPQSDIDAFMSRSLITITQPTGDIQQLRPLIEFDHLPIAEKENLLAFSSFKSPTPIQAAAWPWLFAGRDVIGVAETGSGKTIAFGLPCIRHIMSLPKKKRSKGVKSVIVSPTRELAQQIFEQMDTLASYCGLKACCVYGGVPKPPQQQQIKTSSIVIATPGRLKDLIEDGSTNLSSTSFFVLDEADRMLDKGFEDDIKQIASQVKPTPSRQTLMFTATWPPSVRELAATFMTSPIKINIGENTTGELRANTRITQKVEVMQPMEKQARLVQILKEHQKGEKKNDRILVFCLYKKEAARIEEFIWNKNFRVVGIHGDMSQPKRTENLEAFKRGESNILVATDVAARGLDIPAVKLVLNYTFPLTAEDYVHRIGRTGRAGQEGKSLTFFTEHEKPLSGALINVLKAAKQDVPDALLKFGGTVKKKEHGAYGAFYKDVDLTKKATKITFD